LFGFFTGSMQKVQKIVSQEKSLCWWGCIWARGYHRISVWNWPGIAI